MLTAPARILEDSRSRSTSLTSFLLAPQPRRLPPLRLRRRLHSTPSPRSRLTASDLELVLAKCWSSREGTKLLLCRRNFPGRFQTRYTCNLRVSCSRRHTRFARLDTQAR